jgi:hypothetical protein
MVRRCLRQGYRQSLAGFQKRKSATAIQTNPAGAIEPGRVTISGILKLKGVGRITLKQHFRLLAEERYASSGRGVETARAASSRRPGWP